MLPFAWPEPASDGSIERHRSAVARVRGTIGNGFFEATVTAGIDQTRYEPGAVIDTFRSRELAVKPG